MNKYDQWPETPETEVVSYAQHGFLLYLLNFFEDDMSPFFQRSSKFSLREVHQRNDADYGRQYF
jgi:hypothetical protein